jgi:hypothetical protein
MNTEEFKDVLWNLLCKDIKINTDKSPSSKPGTYTTKVNKKNTGETAYQRALIAQKKHLLEGLAEIEWLDIELPVIFGPSARRKSLDLLGRDAENRLILCELKYDKSEPDSLQKRKPRTDSPSYALRELLTYTFHIIENAKRLQKDNIRHKNSNGTWDWTCCENPENIVLVIAANNTYWKHWQVYSGEGGWQVIRKEIAEITNSLPSCLTIKFYSTPNPPVSFTSQANLQGSIDVKRYIPESLGGDWTEITI